MNTKEAIEFQERLKHCELGIRVDNLEETIGLLEQGEKYKEMWEEFKFKRGDTYINCDKEQIKNIKTIMNKFEEKYFPKAETKYDLCKQDIICDAKRREIMGCKKFKDFYYYIGVVDTLLDTENITVEESIELNDIIQKYLKD